MNKLLTIIIPSYNMEKYLERCLNSLLVDETRLPLLDILVLNDGSKDGTSQIGHRLENKYPDIIRVIDKENGHYGSCVNEGLKYARGAFVKILDADDAFDTTVFKSFLDFLSEENVREKADLILSDYVEVTEDGIVFQTIRYNTYSGSFHLRDLDDADRRRWFIHGLTYRCENLRLIDYRQSEGVPYTDHEWAFVPLTTANTLFKFNGDLYRYTVGRNGQSVEPAQHAKNLPMEIKVVQAMLDAYTKMPVMENPGDQSFIEEQLTGNVENIYCMYLMWLYPYVISFEPLKDFDSVLKENHPDIYSRSGRFRTKVGWMGFYPIRNWRQGRTGLIGIQNALYKVVDKLNAILR